MKVDLICVDIRITLTDLEQLTQLIGLFIKEDIWFTFKSNIFDDEPKEYYLWTLKANWELLKEKGLVGDINEADKGCCNL